MNAFSTFHPMLLVSYLIAVIYLILSTLHPLVIVMAFIGAVSYFITLKGGFQTVRELAFYSCVALLIFLSYSTFVHNGYTPLFFLNDQAITLQAVLKGIAIAVAVVSSCFYFKSYFEIFTTTKILYVTSKLSSKIGIFASMVCRFIPMFKESFSKRKHAMKAIGYFQTASKVERLQRYIKLLLQTFILTAELVFFKPQVMQARGYGRKKRTQYAVIQYTQKDTTLLLMLFLQIFTFVILYEAYRYYYYPTLKQASMTILQIGLIALLMLFPTLYEVKENVKWRYLQSKI